MAGGRLFSVPRAVRRRSGSSVPDLVLLIVLSWPVYGVTPISDSMDNPHTRVRYVSAIIADASYATSQARTSP